MAIVTIAPSGKANGFDVIDGQVVLPRVGAWHAVLTIDADDVLSGKVEIRVGDAGTLVGTVSRTELYLGMVRARVVAGGDGLRKDAMPQHFTTPTIGVVLAALTRGVGEAVSPTADSSVTGIQLEHWTMVAMPAGEVISLLLERAPAGTAWRLLPDGTIWVGAETWPDAALDSAIEVAERPEDALLKIGLAVPWVLPGTSVDGRKVDLAEITIRGGAASAAILTVP